RGGDVVRVEEGVVVGVEGRGELLGGGVQGRVGVTAGGGGRLVVTLEGGDQRSESGARIRVHGWTVHRPRAQWTGENGGPSPGSRAGVRRRPPGPQRPCRISRRGGPLAGHRAQEEPLVRPRPPLTAEVPPVSDPRGRR